MLAQKAIEARRQSTCFACGSQNGHGLGLRFETGTDGSVHASWRPRGEHEGFEGIIHGGIVSTVLDEAMSKAVAAAGEPGLTCHLEVRLRRYVAADESLSIRGWIVERRRRRVRAEAELRDARGFEKAHGWATFLVQHSVE